MNINSFYRLKDNYHALPSLAKLGLAMPCPAGPCQEYEYENPLKKEVGA
jgi:hypothetical protein